jgi:hypothetical protein
MVGHNVGTIGKVKQELSGNTPPHASKSSHGSFKKINKYKLIDV